MVPEIGHFALILALLLSAVQGILPIAGAARGNAAWMAVARPAAQGQFTFVAIAFGCLAYSFVNNDFSVLNVATNSNSQLPIQYRIAATWGSHEGSLLLWVRLSSIVRAKSPRIVPGAESSGFVLPIMSRTVCTAPSASRASATIGPEVMKSTSSPKNGRSLCSA